MRFIRLGYRRVWKYVSVGDCDPRQVKFVGIVLYLVGVAVVGNKSVQRVEEKCYNPTPTRWSDMCAAPANFGSLVGDVGRLTCARKRQEKTSDIRVS